MTVDRSRLLRVLVQLDQDIAQRIGLARRADPLHHHRELRFRFEKFGKWPAAGLVETGPEQVGCRFVKKGNAIVTVNDDDGLGERIEDASRRRIGDGTGARAACAACG